MNKISAIFFDQDETLIHPETGLYEVYVLERAKDFAKAFNIKDLEKAKRKAFEMKKKECGDSTVILYDNMGIPRNVWYDKINQIDVQPYLKKDQVVSTFLTNLKQKGIRLFLLTNSPTLQTKKILKAVGIPWLTFNKVYCWIKGKEPPKPSEKPFWEVFREYNLKPNECLMVGNEILLDLQIAHSLGVITIGINPEPGPKKYMDFQITELEDIEKVIEKLENT